MAGVEPKQEEEKKICNLGKTTRMSQERVAHESAATVFSVGRMQDESGQGCKFSWEDWAVRSTKSNVCTRIGDSAGVRGFLRFLQKSFGRSGVRDVDLGWMIYLHHDTPLRRYY